MHTPPLNDTPRQESVEEIGSKKMVCNHFMVWNIQEGYAYYRCDKCTFIDGVKTFENNTAYTQGRTSMRSDILAVVKNAKAGWYEAGEGLDIEYSAEEMRAELLGKIGGIK